MLTPSRTENTYENGYGRNPYASLTAGAGALAAQPNGLYLGRFAWSDTVTATNVYAAGLLLAFAITTFNAWNWQRVTVQYGAPLLRAGMPCVLMSSGDFMTRFPFGAQAGSQVYANPVTGEASCAASGPVPVLLPNGQYETDSYGNIVYTQGVSYIPTPWTATGSCGVGYSARISRAIEPVFNLAA